MWTSTRAANSISSGACEFTRTFFQAPQAVAMVVLGRWTTGNSEDWQPRFRRQVRLSRSARTSSEPTSQEPNWAAILSAWSFSRHSATRTTTLPASTDLTRQAACSSWSWTTLRQLARGSHPGGAAVSRRAQESQRSGIGMGRERRGRDAPHGAGVWPREDLGRRNAGSPLRIPRRRRPEGLSPWASTRH